MADPTETERYYPFSEGPGEYVTEDDWAAMTQGFQDTGVYGHPGTRNLTIEPGPVPNTIQLNIGDAQVVGYHYRLTAPKVIDTTPNAGTSDRWDTVVLHLNRVNKTITPVLLAGTNVWEIGADRCPVGIWKQPPSSSVTADYWGEAADARWFVGNRVRPYLKSAMPPATPGGMIYDPNEDGQGTVYLGKLDADGTPYWAPWYPVASERTDIKSNESAATSSTSSTTFNGGEPHVSLTFTAPPSGQVMVTVYGMLECEVPGTARLSFEIRSGDSLSSPLIYPASGGNAAVQQGPDFSGSTRRKLVTGLTPGQVYYARTMESTTVAGATATFFHRALMVEPVYTEVAPGSPDSGSSLVPSDVVLTKGGSSIRIPDGDFTTQALSIKVPAGDRADAPDTFAVLYNTGTDTSPNWQRTTYFNEYGELRVVPSRADRVPVRIRLRAGQTNDAVQITDPNNNPIAGFHADGTVFAPNLADVGGGLVPSDSTDAVAPVNPLLRYSRDYAVAPGDPNVLEFRVQGALTTWFNEWGALRTQIYKESDSAIRVTKHATQTANVIELDTADHAQAIWGVDPDGFTIQGNGTAPPVKMAPVLVLGPTDPVPAGTPAGTVILRKGA